LEPIRSKREELLANRDSLLEVFVEGSKKAKEVASQTMERVRQAVNFLRLP
jgi:tryptophanyl-tRNA synthetase